jgi:hypothetical protein
MGSARDLVAGAESFARLRCALLAGAPSGPGTRPGGAGIPASLSLLVARGAIGCVAFRAATASEWCTR